jgi:rubrerythrin
MVGEIQQPTDITKMLELALEVEKKAVEIYTRAHAVCKHQPTLYMLEDQIVDEDKDVEEFQKLLGKLAGPQEKEKRPAA